MKDRSNKKPNDKVVKSTKAKASKDVSQFSSTGIIFQHTARETESLKKNNKTHFAKSQFDSNTDELVYLEIFSSEIFRLLLQPDRVGKVRALYGNDNESDLRSSSRKVDGFKSIQQMSVRVSPQDLSGILIQGGMGKVQVANHVFAENDGHFGNVGLNSAGEVVRIDFDQTLWGIAKNYHLGSRNFDFPITENDVHHLAELPNTTARNSLQKEFENSPLILSNMNKDNQFTADKWFTYLKFLLISEDDYKNRLDYCFPADNQFNEIKKEILDYLILRKEAFKTVLFGMPEFKEYLVTHTEAVQIIQNEFNQLNASYLQSKYSDKKAPLQVDVEKVENEYHLLMLQVKTYPSAYTKLWAKGNNLSAKIIAVMNDYINTKNPFHRGRGNQDQAAEIINWLNANSKASHKEIKTMLIEKINMNKGKKEINTNGSFMKRISFCLKQAAAMEKTDTMTVSLSSQQPQSNSPRNRR